MVIVKSALSVKGVAALAAGTTSRRAQLAKEEVSLDKLRQGIN